MKHHTRGSDEPRFEDLHSQSRQADRKAFQLCRQVQRALNLALAGELFVDEVTPAPDCGRLLVHILIPAGYSASEAIAVLHREAPRLRSEVAGVISRKRAPELYFVPVTGMEGGADE